MILLGLALSKLLLQALRAPQCHTKMTVKTAADDRSRRVRLALLLRRSRTLHSQPRSMATTLDTALRLPLRSTFHPLRQLILASSSTSAQPLHRAARISMHLSTVLASLVRRTRLMYRKRLEPPSQLDLEAS